MHTGHPSWCAGTEADRADHVSTTVGAAESDDPIDIRLRLSQPEDVAADASRWTTLELELVDCGTVFAFPLELRQARALHDCLARLLPPARAAADPARGITETGGRAHSDLGA